MSLQITLEEANGLEEHAQQNHGKCTFCHQTIAIYRYKINKQMAAVLKAMAREFKATRKNKINLSKLGLPYRLESQRSKMRLHGLIAKYKVDGNQVHNTWLITKKGFGFLSGTRIQNTVVVYNNTLLGHEGELVDIYGLSDDSTVQQVKINTSEAKAYGDIRKDTGEYVATAKCKMRNSNYYEKNMVYNLTLKKIQVGKPIEVVKPDKLFYANILQFQKEWEIVK